MSKKFVGFAIALTMLITMVTMGVSLPQAHAATLTNHIQIGSQSTPSEVKVVKAPAKLCDLLIKANPSLATNPNACDIRIVTQNTFVPVKASVRSFTSCPSGTLTHTVWFDSPIGAWWFQMSVIFQWFGNCSTPAVVTNSQNCSQMSSIFPYSISNTYCNHYVSGGSVVAEDDALINIASVGSYTDALQAIAVGSNTSIQDVWI